MALYTGVTGKISVGGNDLAHMVGWNVDLTKTIHEFQSLGKDYKEKRPGIKDWKATFNGHADLDPDSGQKALIDAYENGTKISAGFYLTEDTFMTGDAYIESLSIKDSADGGATIDIAISGDGKPDFTVPPAA